MCLSSGLTKPHSAAHVGPSPVELEPRGAQAAAFPSTEHPGWPRKPTLEQAKEVKSQPLTAIRKSGEACQPLPVPGPLQSSCFMVRLEFQAGMFSRQRWGKCKFQRLRQHFAEEFFACQPPASSKAFLGVGGTSWAWKKARMVWEAATPRVRGQW